jgi:hypothetical protein
MMEPCSDFSGMPELGYAEWTVLVRSLCGQYNPEGIEPENFTGWVRPQTLCGLRRARRKAGRNVLDSGEQEVGCRHRRIAAHICDRGLPRHVGPLEWGSQMTMNLASRARLCFSGIAEVSLNYPIPTCRGSKFDSSPLPCLGPTCAIDCTFPPNQLVASSGRPRPVRGP